MIPYDAFSLEVAVEDGLGKPARNIRMAITNRITLPHLIKINGFLFIVVGVD